eukprot:symbB.v1.2.005281.t1/scaffold305.1/size282400/10
MAAEASSVKRLAVKEPFDKKDDEAPLPTLLEVQPWVSEEKAVKDLPAEIARDDGEIAALKATESAPPLPPKAEEGAPMKATPGLASLANFRQAAAKTNFAEPAGLSDCARQYYSDNIRSVGANSMEAGRQPESAMNSKNQHLHSVHQRYKVMSRKEKELWASCPSVIEEAKRLAEEKSMSKTMSVKEAAREICEALQARRAKEQKMIPGMVQPWAEAKKKEEDEKERTEADAKTKTRKERKKAAEAKKKEEAEKALAEAEAKKKEEDEKERTEADAKTKTRKERKKAAEAKKKEEAEKALAEAEAKKKEEAERALAEAEAKKKEEAEKALAEAEAKKKEEAEKAQAEDF